MNKRIIITLSGAVISLLVLYLLYISGFLSFFFYPSEDKILSRINSEISSLGKSSLDIEKMIAYEGKAIIYLNSDGRMIRVVTNIFNTFSTSKKGITISKIDDDDIQCWKSRNRIVKVELKLRDLPLGYNNKIDELIANYDEIYFHLKKIFNDKKIKQVNTNLWCETKSRKINGKINGKIKKINGVRLD